MMSTTAVTPSQSQPAADPRLEALKQQTAIIAEQQKQLDATLKMRQDQQGMLTGMLPTPTAAPLSGAVTVSGSNPFDSQKLAYEALETAAKDVANSVTASGPIFIYDQAEINSLVSYKAVLKILKALQGHVAHLKAIFSNDLGPRTAALMAQPNQAAQLGQVQFLPVLIPGLLLGGLKTLSDLMGMFRTNTSMAFSSFTADDVALTAAVVRELVTKKKRVYEPGVMPLDAADDTSAFMDNLTQIQNDLVDVQEKATVGQSKLQQLSDALGAVIQAEQAVQANSDPTQAAGLSAAQLAAAQFAEGIFTKNPAIPPATPPNGTTANALKSERDQFLRELGLFVTSVSNMVTTFNTLQTSLMAVTNTGSSTLAAILRTEKLMDKVKTNGAAILLVKTSVLGGSVVTRVNPFSGGHLLYTGGAIVNYTQFDSTGRVTASGVVIKKPVDVEATF